MGNARIMLVASALISNAICCWGQAVAREYLASDSHAPELNAKETTSASPLQIIPIVVNATIEVNGQQNDNKIKGVAPLHASREDILSSAGTYGDFSRYLQLFPGVAFNNDESDDLIVRGGNPIENLYLVDGIEVPNINHLSTEGTTGGLVSMIDTGSIQGVDLRTGGYDSSYPERLSSVVSIQTKQIDGRKRREQGEVGTVGAGGLVEFPLSGQGGVLASAHRSLLNLFTNDIGLNGVPIFENALGNATMNPSARDKITLLSLSGDDSIAIQPCAKDIRETNTINTQYSGWRTTNGMRWQHLFSPSAFGIMTLSDSEQHQHINQQDQFLGAVSEKWSTCDLPASAFTPITVYQELTNDGVTNLRYDYFSQLGTRINLKMGGAGSLKRFNYKIAQPTGAQSPLSLNPARSDATSFAPRLSSGETGFYVEGSFQFTKQFSASLGGRIQTFAIDGSSSVTPRAALNYRMSEHTGLYAAFGDYAQLAPAAYLFAFPQNRHLLPIRARHYIAGVNLWDSHAIKTKIEAYKKEYWDYPVSTEYPSLSLADMVDNLGEQFIWLPLTSSGLGRSEGVELSAESSIPSHLHTQANVAYARSEFAGLDGIFRPGNLDYPFVGNLMMTYMSGKRYEASARYEYASGRPYTPFLLAASIAQNRPIYDTSRINAVRGPVYSRLDFQVDRIFNLGDRKLAIYGGLQNAFNRENLLAYEWLPRCTTSGRCMQGYDNVPVSPIYQIPLFPNIGVRYWF
ncbi:TonB-dependent receptor [Alloacidobacterium dinghuense]|uniref:TonB-dependent receptor n=1 Tax=Alloacidobacterium dinghuense TaxID=2763107 RepID=A0A7G8BE00_9BACT|nr:TonB-dependent receptor [Alloacidobacterium dinghuense]QNI30770.1 TonB-dependent receptor [Alloacidobacterium dinghuense]